MSITDKDLARIKVEATEGVDAGTHWEDCWKASHGAHRPCTILALIAEVEKLRAEDKKLRKLLADAILEIEQLLDETRELHAENAELTKHLGIGLVRK